MFEGAQIKEESQLSIHHCYIFIDMTVFFPNGSKYHALGVPSQVDLSKGYRLWPKQFFIIDWLLALRQYYIFVADGLVFHIHDQIIPWRSSKNPSEVGWWPPGVLALGAKVSMLSSMSSSHWRKCQKTWLALDQVFFAWVVGDDWNIQTNKH